MRVRFLGTGTSHGIPVIGCGCPVCTSTDPRNKRLRSSILVEWDDHRIVVDTTPEFRLQALAAGLQTLDAVCFTHAHADHIFGLDDVRIFNWRTKQPMPIFGTAATLEDIHSRFIYAFQETQRGGGKPQLDLHTIDGPFELAGVRITPLEVMHGTLPVTAFRFDAPAEAASEVTFEASAYAPRVTPRDVPDGMDENVPIGNHRGAAFAYVTDCSAIGAATMAALHGLDLLILDALGKNRHPTHFSLEEAIEVAEALSPRQTLFTHISHSLEHAETNTALPPGMALAFDGQEVRL